MKYLIQLASLLIACGILHAQKVSELPSITGSTVDPAVDLFLMVDSSAGASKKITIGEMVNIPSFFGSVSATELGYLDGVTSSVQTQLDARAPLIISGTNNAFVFEGDSLSADGLVGVGNDWPTRLVALPLLSGKGTKYNVATASETLANITSQYAAQVYPRRPAANGGAPAWLFVWIGANDVGSMTPASYIASLESYWGTAKTDGFTVVAFTISPGNYVQAQGLTRQDINRRIRLSSVPDYLVDVAALFPDKTDTALYSDGLHLTAAANTVLAREAQTVLLGRRGSMVPDTTAAKFITGPLDVGYPLTFGGTFAERQLGVSYSSVNAATVAGAFRNDWTPVANTASSAEGIVSQVFKLGSQAITPGGLTPFTATATNRGSGALYSIVGYDTHIGNQTATYGGGTAAVTNLMHFHASAPITAGATEPITNAYGLVIEDQKVTGVTNGYGIVQNGVNTANSFFGPTTFWSALSAQGGVVMPAGSAATPAMRWSGSGGFYTPNGSDTSIAVSGSNVATFDPTRLTLAGSATVNGGNLTINGSSFPGVKFYNTSSSSDEHWWDLYYHGTNLVHRAVADSGAAGTSYMTITRSGYTVPQIAFDTAALTTTGAFTASGRTTASGGLVVPTSTPASASATGTTGTITWDASYIYICTATNTWKRVAIATW
jgi:lysophospholipase L1-like esterase